jgi:hypothetical protein
MSDGLHSCDPYVLYPKVLTFHSQENRTNAKGISFLLLHERNMLNCTFFTHIG